MEENIMKQNILLVIALLVLTLPLANASDDVFFKGDIIEGVSTTVTLEDTTTVAFEVTDIDETTKRCRITWDGQDFGWINEGVTKAVTSTTELRIKDVEDDEGCEVEIREIDDDDYIESIFDDEDYIESIFDDDELEGSAICIALYRDCLTTDILLTDNIIDIDEYIRNYCKENIYDICQRDNGDKYIPPHPTETDVVYRTNTPSPGETVQPSCVDGCYLREEEHCLPTGMRIEQESVDGYCDIDGLIKAQLQDGESAQNDYECISNSARYGTCEDIQEQTNILKKMFGWLSRFFGG